MKNVVTAILGGGRGERLWPLTKFRAKPAVPLGGKFRLIDIPISNSLHAGIERIFVMTQFNSASLHRHISQTYRFDVFSGGFVNILAAEQNVGSRDWYQGTADAVRKNLRRLDETQSTEILILSGDQLYLMSLRSFVEMHRERDADLSIAVKPVVREEASGLGIMRIDSTGRIVEFVEKPTDDGVLDSLTLDAETIAQLGIEAEPGMLLASMGIYVFRKQLMVDLLEGTTETDFGKEIIPNVIHKHRVFAFVESGYWRDIGTIPAFHQANLELAVPVPALDLYSARYPIYTHPRFLPGSKIHHCEISHSILSDGTILSGSRITASIIGIRAVINEGSVIERSVIMGATDFWKIGAAQGLQLGIGRNCEIRNSIIDLDARIGDGSRLVNEEGIEEADEENYTIRGGIIVVQKGAELPPGTVI